MLKFISLSLFSNKYLLSTYYSLSVVGDGALQIDRVPVLTELTLRRGAQKSRQASLGR